MAASRGLSGIKLSTLYINFFFFKTSISNCSFGQGQSRRIQVEVKSVQESGTLPLMEESILSVGVGCVQIKHVKSQNYQVKLWIFTVTYFQELESIKGIIFHGRNNTCKMFCASSGLGWVFFSYLWKQHSLNTLEEEKKMQIFLKSIRRFFLCRFYFKY